MNDLLKQLIALTGGYKTYIAAVGLIALGVYDYTQGDATGGTQHLMQGLGLLGLRHALGTTAGPGDGTPVVPTPAGPGPESPPVVLALTPPPAPAAGPGLNRLRVYDPFPN